MDAFPRGKSAIVGSATWGLGEMPGSSTLELASQAVLMALDDCGIGLDEVDGLFGVLSDDTLAGLGLSEYLGIRPRVTDNNRVGGSSFLTHVMWAALALETGQCDVAVIAYGSNQRTASGRLVSAAKRDPYEAPYEPLLPPTAYALAAARHMHDFGTTRAQLAEVAVSARKWAMLNPEAVMRDPLTIDDCLAARMVSDPLSVRDCCLVTDGAAALVMVRADRGRDIGRRPAYVLGAANEGHHFNISSMPDLTTTSARESGRRAFAQAGYGPADVDMVQLYDAFTINTIMFLEDLGFCPKGEGGRFVSDGHIAPGGGLPVNTNGGGLSCAHPGMYGMFTLVEAHKQIANRAGTRQVADTELTVSHGSGGYFSNQATVILGSEATL